LVAKSRLLIDGYPISADDALHVYTAFIYDCDFLLMHDNRIVTPLKADPLTRLEVIDLGSRADREYLRRQLNL
ncbi:MAG: hypothetical protein AB1753_04240, partial [Thermoproteota archaeon]